uniref:Uncharacterized protein n=1 Tax=Magallana gigas TaxID=29159 RepID=K1RDT8_MAGGI
MKATCKLRSAAYLPSSNECSGNDCGDVYQFLRDFRNDINELKHSVRELQKKVLGEGPNVLEAVNYFRSDKKFGKCAL